MHAAAAMFNILFFSNNINIFIFNSVGMDLGFSERGTKPSSKFLKKGIWRVKFLVFVLLKSKV